MLPECISKTCPSVTVAIPTYNESACIKKLIENFLATNYPNLIEIIVADGGSTDNTQDIVKEISQHNSKVKLVTNPDKIQSAGLNLILAVATGDIIIRADAHSDYADNYVEKCVAALLDSQALNVGGAQRFVAKESFQAGVAIASKSFLGSGGAKYRDPKYTGYADTVYLGCFWREILLEISSNTNNKNHNKILIPNVFDTSQITNQDAELNQKLLKKSSQAIYISSDIKVWYYPRKNWKSLWVQYFKYGRGRYLTSIKHPEGKQLRGKLPFFAISFLILISIIDFSVSRVNLPLQEIYILGLLLPFVESLRINLQLQPIFTQEIWRGNPEQIPPLILRWIYCSIAILTMPLAHFSGYGYQLLRCKITGIVTW
ncbi:MAG: glycosyltransferase family 2 protein [Xenococcaceae cyanobacterium MO_167.B27]|nr:glycosyltransferase family 2 protein [Xenococcaceae cyanobacterium MO_167.B27]